MNFIRSLSPGRTPKHIAEKDELAVLRERILQTMLLVISVVTFLVFVFASVRNIPANNWWAEIVWIIFTASVIAIAVLRNIRYSIRATYVMAFLYGISVFMLFPGASMTSTSPLLLFAFSVLTSALGGSRAGTIASILAIITYILFGILIIQPAAGTNIIVQTQAMGWLQILSILIISITITNVILNIILNFLESSLTKQTLLTEALGATSDDLQKQIELRSHELNLRDRQVNMINEVSQIIARSENVDHLLKNVLDQVNQLFNFYHSSIFLIDQPREFAVLRASTSDAGRTLLEQHHRLRVGEVGMVGFVVSKGEARISQNVANDPIHFRNPMLPATNSEVTLPLVINQEVAGALDVQSTLVNGFSDDDIKLLFSVAEQLSYAIERIQILEKLQADYSQVESAYRRLTQSAWSAYLKTARKSFSYRFKNNTILPDVEPNPEVKDAIINRASRPQSSQIDIGNEEQISTLAIPILLRDQPLGILNLRFNAQQVSKDQIELLETTTARLALALENARLVEEVQNRAAREHLVGDITSKVRASTDIERILRTTAEEIGKSLGVSEVLVQLRSSE